MYADLAIGTGAQPGAGDFVIVDYIAYLSNGTVFDNTSSPGRKPLVFQMGQNKVVPGLETAIGGMRMGGHRLAIIPPRLAYGERGVCFPDQGCLVPPDSTLEYVQDSLDWALLCCILVPVLTIASLWHETYDFPALDCVFLLFPAPVPADTISRKFRILVLPLLLRLRLVMKRARLRMKQKPVPSIANAFFCSPTIPALLPFPSLSRVAVSPI